MPPRAREAGVVAWCSFLAAGVGTMTLFAFVDPAQLRLEAVPVLSQSRLAMYALGFFLFWATSAVAALLTLVLVRSVDR